MHFCTSDWNNVPWLHFVLDLWIKAPFCVVYMPQWKALKSTGSWSKFCKWELCVLGVLKILARHFLGGLEEKVHRRQFTCCLHHCFPGMWNVWNDKMNWTQFLLNTDGNDEVLFPVLFPLITKLLSVPATCSLWILQWAVGWWGLLAEVTDGVFA